VTSRPTGALDPATGKPFGADDPFFTGVNNELADKGFLVTTVRSSSPGPAPAR
jgi:NADH-quinone oxidoreductase subunit B